jgi:hypothetical protein
MAGVSSLAVQLSSSLSTQGRKGRSVLQRKSHNPLRFSAFSAFVLIRFLLASEF